MTTHNQQIDEAITRSLNLAGIRPRYHRQQLDRHPSVHAEALRDWVIGTSVHEPSCGWTLIGGNDIEDLAILLARGLHMTGRATQVMSVIYFQRLLSTDRAYLQDVTADAQGLLLTQMGPKDPREGEVFTARETRTMEAWLEDWVADGHRLLIHAGRPLAGGWFSAAFVQRVATLNEMIREDAA